MSKYTTQVRYICEHDAEYEQSVGFNNVDDVIARSWFRIFTSDVEFFEEEYRAKLCRKIIKHYYLREICCETVGLWKLWMNTRLEEIMPYYNELYKSAQIKYDPLHDFNYTREFTTNRQQNDETKGTTNSSGNSSVKNNANDLRLFSDTPQGGINGVENMNYLTNVTKDTSNTDGSTNSSYTQYNGESKDVTGVEKGSESVSGKRGSSSYQDLIIQYRKTMINIDNMVIDEFKDLFMGLW